MSNSFFHFDLGNLLTILSFIAILYKFHLENTKKINMMEWQIGLMWRAFCKKFDLDPILKLEENEGR